MKTIKYANYKKNETMYVQVRGTYNSEDKTTKVYDRKVIEFDNQLKDGSKIHLKFINTNFESDKARFDYYYKKIDEMEEEFDYSDCFFSTTNRIKVSEKFVQFYRDNKEVFDKLIKEKTGYDPYFDELKTRQKVECFNVINEVFTDLLCNTFYLLTYNSYLDMFKEFEEKEIFNVKIYDPDAADRTNEASSEKASEQPTKAENMEVKEEEQTKVITMRYFEYKQTNFKSVKDSYDSVKQTIDVYVPLDYKPAEMKVVKVNYDDYKEKYRDKYEQVYNSYDSSDRTIEIRVPANIEIESTKFHIVEMLFKDYKQKYSQYKTAGSYSDINGTIKVYLPECVEYVKADKDKNYEIKHAFRKGYIDDITITPKKLNIDDFDNTIPAELMI